MTIRGVVLAGGTATRLESLTAFLNKHVLPVGNLPMIYYPLIMLWKAGIKEVCLTTGLNHAGQIMDSVLDGHVCRRGSTEILFALDATYRVQTQPGGIGQAVALAENFANNGPVLVALGDNLFQFTIEPFVEACRQSPDMARILLAKVEHPEQYGVAILSEDSKKIMEIIEKPTPEKGYAKPPSNWAVTGVYYYPFDVFEKIRGLTPSARGEMEITDVNNLFIKEGRLAYGYCCGWWADAGESTEALVRDGELVLRTGANNPFPEM